MLMDTVESVRRGEKKVEHEMSDVERHDMMMTKCAMKAEEDVYQDIVRLLDVQGMMLRARS